jgi:hypothetical protein
VARRTGRGGAKWRGSARREGGMAHQEERGADITQPPMICFLVLNGFERDCIRWLGADPIGRRTRMIS